MSIKLNSIFYLNFYLLTLVSLSAIAQIPNAPTNLVVTPINTGGMIQFSAPTNFGGSAITNYEYSTDNGATWIIPSPAITSSPIIISSGLINCTSYQVKIRAVNASGSGTASAVATLVPSTSSDFGAIWTSRTSAVDNPWQSVTYGNGLFVAVANTGTGNRVMTSPDGINWTSRTSAADNNWSSVTYGNGLFVAVASNSIMTSPDGINWIIRTSPASNNWTSVTYGKGLFVAVAISGSGNRVMTSPDGITWTSRTSATNNNWRSVTYGNDLFVAVAETGTGNRVMTSSDGINWTSRASAVDNNWYGVTYGNGLFVAVSNNGSGNRVMTSPDGINWTSRTSAADNSWSNITYGNGLFFAVATSGLGNRVMTSPDGITWTSRTPPADIQWLGVTYGNGLFVAVAQNGISNRVMTSGYSVVADAPLISAINPRINGAQVIFSNTPSVFAPAISNYEYSADDGSTWIARSPASDQSPFTITGLSNETLYSFKIRSINSVGASCASSSVSVTPSLGTVSDAPTNLVVKAINTGGMIQFTAPANDGGSDITNYEYSTDNGATWVTPNPAFTKSPLIISSGLTNCTSYQVKLRAVNAAGSGAATSAIQLIPATSVDMGVQWTARNHAADNTWQSVTYGNGLFVAVANSGVGNRVMTSPNGINWTSRTSGADNQWQSVTYGNGLFVAVAKDGSGNRVMTSPDGITWTSRTIALNNNWTSVTYGNGLFVAVANSGTGNRVMTSPNGINWTSRASASDNGWTSVTYGNGLFVAVASNSVMTSPDGTTWTSRTSASNNSWTSVTYGNGLFVAVANSGTGNRVMTSSNGINWTSRTSAVDNNWTSVTYGNGLFVAVANSGTGNHVMTSPDGTTWTSRTSTVNNLWSGVTYGNGLFVAVAYSNTGEKVMTSSYNVVADTPEISVINARNNGAQVVFSTTASVFEPAITNYEYSTDNGVNWTLRSPVSNISPLTITGLSNGILYDIKIRAINSVGPSCASSSVSVTPSLGTLPDAPTNLAVKPINTGGMIQFTAPANDGGSDITNYEYSTDNGATWVTPSQAVTTSPLIITSGLTNCISYQVKIRAINAAGRGAATSAIQLIPATSVDMGVQWTSRTSAVDNTWQSVTYGNGLFVAVANSGTGNRVMTSPDGINWTSRTSAEDICWKSVTYGNGLFVAVANCNSGSGNRVMTSPDGINWTSRASGPGTINWLGVTYNNGLFVAVGNGGIITSSDGIYWVPRVIPATAAGGMKSVTYGNGLFVAVAFSGNAPLNRVMTSPDGINWTSRTSAADNNNWYGVTYGNGLFVAVSNNGTGNRVMTSPDGINWTSRTSAADNEWWGVTYGNGLFVAVSKTGTGNRVMTSPDGINWTSKTSATDNAWISVTYGNGLFVAVSENGTGNRVMTSGYNVVADAPVITAAPVNQTETAVVSFTQPTSVFASAIINYQYSIDNGVNWTTLSLISNPITLNGITDFINQIQLQAINSVGNSCPATFKIGSNLNKYGQKTSTGSEFVNQYGALGITGIRTTGENRTYTPVISATVDVTDINATTATSGGTVDSDKGFSITARGVCWSTTTNPTTANSLTTDGTGTGMFRSAITGLTSGTTYYVRSYATNSAGTSYGPEVSFTTF